MKRVVGPFLLVLAVFGILFAAICRRSHRQAAPARDTPSDSGPAKTAVSDRTAARATHPAIADETPIAVAPDEIEKTGRRGEPRKADPSDKSADVARPGSRDNQEPGRAPGKEPGAAAHPDVARSAFTGSIQNREPVGSVPVNPFRGSRILYFTEIRNRAGEQITHRWFHGDQQIQTVNFQVGGNRWRVWSRKDLSPNSKGEWRVEVVDGKGRVLRSDRFHHEPGPRSDGK
jgi:hypothetical protein